MSFRPTDQSPPPGVEVKKILTYTSTPPYAFMKCDRICSFFAGCLTIHTNHTHIKILIAFSFIGVRICLILYQTIKFIFFCGTLNSKEGNLRKNTIDQRTSKLSVSIVYANRTIIYVQQIWLVALYRVAFIKKQYFQRCIRTSCLQTGVAIVFLRIWKMNLSLQATLCWAHDRSRKSSLETASNGIVSRCIGNSDLCELILMPTWTHNLDVGEEMLAVWEFVFFTRRWNRRIAPGISSSYIIVSISLPVVQTCGRVCLYGSSGQLTYALW
jgi:hypothetical protein